MPNNNLFKQIMYYSCLVIFAIIWGMGQWPEFFYFRFFGLIPFIYIILYRKNYLLESLIFGWIAYLINFYWLFITFYESGKIPIIISSLIIAGLCLYYGLQYLLIAFIYKKFIKINKAFYYLFPVIFVFVDFLFPKLFTHSIADSQINFKYFVQLIDITGMTGLILIIMYINLGLFNLINKGINGNKIKAYDFIFILPFVLALIYGEFRLNYLEKKAKVCAAVKASLIQGNINGKQKRENSMYANIEVYNQLTKQAIIDNSNDPVDFIIWPESAFSHAYDGTLESLNSLIYENYPMLVLGITFIHNRQPENLDVRNSCLLIKDKREIQRYEKRHLMVFGEYIPFEKTFPFLKNLTPLYYSMRKGDTPSVFHISPNIHACISICFEDIFPDEMRNKINEGCNLMINITNDSWYGKGLGPLHHSILARLRAIENRRSFYRCTGTGLTSASDFTGKVIAKSQMWQEQVITARLPLFTERTIYSYIGEMFSYICIIIVLAIIMFALRMYFVNKEVKHFDKESNLVFYRMVDRIRRRKMNYKKIELNAKTAKKITKRKK